MRMQTIGLVAVAAATLAAATAAVAGPGEKGHAHATFNAGTPGDPKKPSRIIEVKATEGNGTMAYDPARIVVEQNEQIRFVIKNTGELDHEFMLESLEANAKHLIEMQKNPEMEHDDPNGKRIVTKKEAEIVWKFSKLGTYEYACLIPGHYEAGMKGVVEVVAKGKAKAAAAPTAAAKSAAK